MSAAAQAAEKGKVYLVGAGPGDPDLITWRGLELIRSADVILYDNLASPSLLSHARPDAETLYVGKKRALHQLSQQQINELLAAKARQGLAVVRLKGGDPYVFGRGGEEAEALIAAGVEFEVVPGVSSALGAAAYAGVPLTHRSRTSAVTFVTGHEADAIDWQRLGHTETLVIFMGLTAFDAIADRLIAAGRAPHTPAMAVRWATRPCQQTVVGRLDDLGAKIEAAGLRPPALIVVGEVVALREKLDWYERLPLFGRRILITRPAGQAADFAARLRRLGAEPIEAPTIEIRPPDDWAPLDAAIAALGDYDWLIFTSRNGVDRFLERLDASPRDLRAVRGKIAAIGPATAQRLEQLHLKVDVLPDDFVAEGLLAALDAEDLRGQRILIPRALQARETLPAELAARGALVDVVPAYQTVEPPDAAERLQAIFEGEDKPDWAVCTSSSTVRNLAKLVGPERLAGVRLCSIGPITSQTARELGLPVAAEANPYTMEGVLEALLQAVRTS
ncbi:MAG: uroporphyrinogen-III C-methyltransferase [Acidobacteria bacterium]|nr:uroporphyrinogen-III C-methyltransferase [Acidobacteriota bacterium]